MRVRNDCKRIAGNGGPPKAAPTYAYKYKTHIRKAPNMENTSSVKVVKTYTQTMPATRFVGIKYGDGDRVDGMFGEKWHEWLESDRFAAIGNASGGAGDFFEDSGAPIGLMRYKDGEPFEYWIGMFTPAGTAVPEGFAHLDFAESNIGVCWLRGPESEIYARDELVMEAFKENGIEAKPGADGAWWFFERYAETRFSVTDADGSIILDHCYFLG